MLYKYTQSFIITHFLALLVQQQYHQRMIIQLASATESLAWPAGAKTAAVEIRQTQPPHWSAILSWDCWEVHARRKEHVPTVPSYRVSLAVSFCCSNCSFRQASKLACMLAKLPTTALLHWWSNKRVLLRVPSLNLVHWPHHLLSVRGRGCPRRAWWRILWPLIPKVDQVQHVVGSGPRNALPS